MHFAFQEGRVQLIRKEEEDKTLKNQAVSTINWKEKKFNERSESDI